MNEPRRLYVYCNGTDWVIACDEADALAVWCEYTGQAREDYDISEPFEQWPDDRLLSVFTDEHGNICEPGDDGGAPMKRTCREWAKLEGRGFLCSTE